MPGTLSQVIGHWGRGGWGCSIVVLTLALAVATTKKKRQHRWWVHSMLEKRKQYGAYHHLEHDQFSDQYSTISSTLSPVTFRVPPFGIFNSWGVKNTSRLQDQPGGNVCMHNQYPHVVSVCAVYVSVTWKSYRQIVTCSDILQMPLFMDGITDGYGCGYREMETCQHNLMGAIFSYVYVCGCRCGYRQKET